MVSLTVPSRASWRNHTEIVWRGVIIYITAQTYEQKKNVIPAFVGKTKSVNFYL